MLSRIAIDASSAGSTGAIKYLSSICLALSEQSPETTFLLLCRESQMRRLPELAANFEWVPISARTRSRAFRLPWLQLGLPRLLDRFQAEVLFATSDVSTWRAPCPSVLLVHNVNPFSDIRGQIWNRRQLLRLALQRELVRRSARGACRLIFVSEWSRQLMLPALGVPVEKTTVVYHGVDSRFRSRLAGDGASQEDRRHLLVVSSMLEHKNIRRLLEAYLRLVQSLGPAGRMLRLTIVGAEGSLDARRSHERLLDANGLLPQVRFLEAVPADDLLSLYRQAEMLVFPSIEESFGLPLVEAMALGLPVVSSNTAAMPEICGDAAHYFCPFDVADMARAMGQVLADPTRREEMVRKGIQRASAFSWSRAVEQVLTILNAVTAATRRA